MQIGDLFRTKKTPVFHTGGVVGPKSSEVVVTVKPSDYDQEKLDNRAGWAAWGEAVDGFQREWDRLVAEATSKLDPVEPFRIFQEDSGWWRVARRTVHVFGSSPEERTENQWRYNSFDYIPKPPALEVGTPSVGWKFVNYEPTFKTFAEANDWARDTALLGKHSFGVGLNGEIQSCSDPDGLEHLAPAIQASHDAQERATERAASYEETALF